MIELKEELMEKYGKIWNTKELQQDFTVKGFSAPFVVVIRKFDNKLGSLQFTHYPRFYFNFVED